MTAQVVASKFVLPLPVVDRLLNRYISDGSAGRFLEACS